ncbi:FHA domain-containing protein [Paenibacillus sp. M1]|uniref:FHA domain-containing protein n=1 Tax=Paenibacillus haidiansis TaxID=1574488 RepID=A0ABU7VQ93_9BACL
MYIIRGEPYRPGTCINLSEPDTEVGRASKDNSPDVAFSNIFISRKHLQIRREGEKAVLYDLGSRHGSEVNGVRVIPYAPYVLETNDRIELARGTAVLHFSYTTGEQTLEFDALRTEPERVESEAGHVTILWEKRECHIDGHKIPMSEKEFLLIQLLHQHINRLVTMAEIKSVVWHDRALGNDGLPDVTADEISALIYRIRKKYGKDAFRITAVRGNGYILEGDSYT